MYINSIVYLFGTREVIVRKPSKIVRETAKCFFTEDGYRWVKSEIGVPRLKSPTHYTYIELAMVDADEKILREELSKWFSTKAYEVRTYEK